MSCLVMQPFAMNWSSSTQLTLEKVNQELQRKRKALDEEIRRFTAEKDAEFKAFEKEIQNHLKELSARKTQTSKGGTSVIERGFSVDKPYTAPPLSIAEDSQSCQTNIQSPEIAPLITAPNTDTFTKQPIETRPSIRHTFSREDRQFELGALFTSSYLPLLDSTFIQQDYRKALSNKDERISSSLDIESQVPKAERPPFSDRRLSSSPIKTGQGNKKSSMRRSVGSDPTRERKRVLFSIDNQVISPNASPENVRTASLIAPLSSLSNPHSDHTAIAGLDAAIQMASISPWTQKPPLISPTRTYKDLVEPTVVTPPEELEQEDLHLITRDPLFDSDEPSQPFEEEEWPQSPSDSRSSDEEEPIGTSPHVSSVPIQIRQKGRR